MLKGVPHRGRRSAGGVGLVTKGWNIDTTQIYGPNVVSCEVVSGIHQTPLIRAYLPMTTLGHLPNIEETLHFFMGGDIIVLGDLKMYVRRMGNP